MTDKNTLNQLWFTRCPVPTATGIAYKLGWLEEEFEKDGIKISTLQDATSELRRHHYDHQISALIREGGSLLALAAKAQGAPTKLIGLTWIDEWQAILVRPNSEIRNPVDLKGKRLALPEFIRHPIPEHVRGSSIARGMSLHGYVGVLRSAGLSLDDVELVEVPSGRDNVNSLGNLWTGIEELMAGNLDAVYVKGASAVEKAKRLGALVGIDLDKFSDKSFRVNNGTPRPITVHQSLLDSHLDLVARFLYQTLRAADWSKTNLISLRQILKSETRSGDEGVQSAYRDDFNLTLAPDLSREKLELFEQQKKFMLVHGLLDRDFDLNEWVDVRPLALAREWLENKQSKFAA